MKQEMMGWEIIWKSFAPCCGQITTPAPHQLAVTGRMLFLMPNQQCQSKECTFVAAYKAQKLISAHRLGNSFQRRCLARGGSDERRGDIKEFEQYILHPGPWKPDFGDCLSRSNPHPASRFQNAGL